jgi:NAD(P)-dependent dehydrogenase (short-subunit alcohol dehydrogenase family)
MTLQGKRAIVLGGTSGIGLAATNQLASEGVSVVAASRHPQRAQQSVRAGVELQVCDVQDREVIPIRCGWPPSTWTSGVLLYW